MPDLNIQTEKFLQHLQQGDIDRALRFANDVSQKRPDNPQGYAMLGDALMHKGEHELATSCYQLALQKKQDLPAVHVALGEACLLLGETGKAYAYFYKALELAPENAEILLKTGSFLVMVGRLNDARTVLEKALALGAEDAFQSLLDLKIHIGDKQDIRQFIEQNKQQLNSHISDLTVIRAQYSLGNYDDVIAQLKTQDASRLTPSARAAYYNLLASAYEKKGRYKRAFDYFQRQNESKPLAYNPAQMEQTVQQIMDNSARMDTSSVHYRDITDQEFSPLYIIGLPRSGTSLLEQILNTSEHVVAGGELLFVEAAYKKYFEKHMPLEEISQWYREKVEFITKNQEIPKQAPRWLTDKLPSNFVNVGFIKKMIPDARFLYCKRNPMDNGLSIYKQNFLSSLSYATRQQDIAHFISLERRVMTHWLELYPNDILTVEYEQLVTDFNPVTQQVFDFADLKWREEVKYFYRNKHYCNTASFEQVRQPVNDHSVNSYRKYEQAMQPMLKRLADLAI